MLLTGLDPILSELQKYLNDTQLRIWITERVLPDISGYEQWPIEKKLKFNNLQLIELLQEKEILIQIHQQINLLIQKDSDERAALIEFSLNAKEWFDSAMRNIRNNMLQHEKFIATQAALILINGQLQNSWDVIKNINTALNEIIRDTDQTIKNQEKDLFAILKELENFDRVNLGLLHTVINKIFAAHPALQEAERLLASFDTQKSFVSVYQQIENLIKEKINPEPKNIGRDYSLFCALQLKAEKRDKLLNAFQIGSDHVANLKDLNYKAHKNLVKIDKLASQPNISSVELLNLNNEKDNLKQDFSAQKQSFLDLKAILKNFREDKPLDLRPKISNDNQPQNEILSNSVSARKP